jgi:hypothetical protein
MRPQHKDTADHRRVSMGRLRKAKIDMIGKMRQEGYTQAETAEKTGVHLKTVQKYDPLKRSGKAASPRKTGSVSKEDLEFRLRTLEDWIAAIYYTLLDKLGTRVACPECCEYELFTDEEDEDLYICKNCHYRMRAPSRGSK